MIVICEECGQKYHLDPARIKGPEARFACKVCGHRITVTKTETTRKNAMPPSAPAVPPPVEPQTSGTPAATDRSLENQDLAEKPVKKNLIPAQFMRLSRFRLGLTPKIFILMVLVGMVPLAIFWGITLSQTRERIRAEADRYNAQLFAGTVRFVDAWFGEKERVVRVLAKTDAMVSMNPGLQESLLEAAATIDPQLKGLFVVDAAGKYVAGKMDRLAANNSNSSVYQSLMRSQTPRWKILKNAKTDKPALMLAVPIANPAGPVGAIVFLMEIEKMAKQIAGHEAGHADFAFLVKHQQAVTAYPVAAHGVRGRPLQWPPLIDAFKEGRLGLVSFQDPEDEAVLAYVGRTKFDWGVAIQQDEVEVAARIDQWMAFAYILLALIIVTVSIIAWFSGRAISRPIIGLTDAANRISIGELDTEIRTKRKDEIGDLSEAIARMQDSIRIAIERLRRRSERT